MNPDGQGQRTQDTQRKQEGPQAEAMGQGVWQPEARSASGEALGEQSSKGNPRIIKFENSLQMKESIRIDADTTQDIEKRLLALFPIDSHHIGMLFSYSQEGTMNRKFVEGALDPSEFFIYVKLYLKKHPPLS